MNHSQDLYDFLSPLTYRSCIRALNASMWTYIPYTTRSRTVHPVSIQVFISSSKRQTISTCTHCAHCVSIGYGGERQRRRRHSRPHANTCLWLLLCLSRLLQSLLDITPLLPECGSVTHQMGLSHIHVVLALRSYHDRGIWNARDENAGYGMRTHWYMLGTW